MHKRHFFAIINLAYLKKRVDVIKPGLYVERIKCIAEPMEIEEGRRSKRDVSNSKPWRQYYCSFMGVADP